MTFDLRPIVINDGDWLNECPDCGGNNLHQSHVSIFNTDGMFPEWDDSRGEYVNKVKTRVTHVMADNTISSARVPPEHTNNPSRDRNGMLIEFWCEGCDNKPTLAIFQHKGTTFIGWK